MDVKAFAVDVDGTLTIDGGAIDLGAASTLRWLHRLGVEVVLVSGRSIWEVLAIAKCIGTSRIAVGENGGVVAASPTQMVLLGDKGISLEAYERLSRRLEGLELMPVFPRFTEVVLKRNFDLQLGNSFLSEEGLPVRITDSMYAYHLAHRSVDKAGGLRVALRRLGVEAECCVAVGDSETDIPMFRLCGYSIALGNSPQSVRLEAKYTVEAGYGRGLEEAVQHVAERFMKAELADTG